MRCEMNLPLLSSPLWVLAYPERPWPKQALALGTPPWSAETAYNDGDVVSHEGAEYSAQWWTQGEEPGTTGEWGGWKLIGAC